MKLQKATLFALFAILELARDPPDRRRLLLLDLVLEDVESRFRASHCLSLFERADDTPTPQGARA